MTVNSAGFIQVLDGGSPRYVGGKAKDAIGAGEFVFASGADNVVSSGLNSFVTADIEFAADASGAQVTGVAIAAAASGADMTVATRGAIIAVANGTVTASFPVLVDGNNAVANAGSVAGNLAHQRIVGRAFTSAASGGHCIVHLNL